MELKDIKELENQTKQSNEKKVGFLLGLGILFMPYIFSWFTLRKGHSNFAKGASFAWLFVIVIAAANKDPNNHSRTVASSSNSTTRTVAENEQLAFVSDSCLSLSKAFGAGSSYSDIQKKELWKNYKNKGFNWNLRVAEVSEAMLGNGYQVQFKCERSDAFVSDIIIDYPESAKGEVMQLQKGSLYTVKGKLEDYNSLIGLSGEAL